MNVFLNDVKDQPKTMREAYAQYLTYKDEFERIRLLKPARVLFCGMGSSHYCSQSAVIRLNGGGITADMESASEILHYEQGRIADALLVLTSQSGKSGEIVKLIERLPATTTVIGITNDLNSPLGKRADIALEMRVADELAVSTRTYLASLVLSDMLATALLGGDPLSEKEEMQTAIEALTQLVAQADSLTGKIRACLGDPNFICYAGRGYARACAECGALFTRETAKYPAIGFDSGEFRHGPFEMVEPGFSCMLFAPLGTSFEMQRALALDVAGHGGRAVLVTDSDEIIDSANVLTLRHAPVPERLSAIVQIVPAQLFANYTALRLGRAPGVFRQSSKVTVSE